MSGKHHSKAGWKACQILARDGRSALAVVVVSVRSRHHHFGQASCNIHLCSVCHLGLVLGHHEGVKLRKDAGIRQLGGCALSLRIHALPVEESCQCNVRNQLVGVQSGTAPRHDPQCSQVCSHSSPFLHDLELNY